MIQTSSYTIFFGVALSTTFIPLYLYFYLFAYLPSFRVFCKGSRVNMLKFNDRSLNELSSSMGLKVVVIENTIFEMDRKPLQKKDGNVYHVIEKMSKTRHFLLAQCHEN
jgi:hypothetical protein